MKRALTYIGLVAAIAAALAAAIGIPGPQPKPDYASELVGKLPQSGTSRNVLEIMDESEGAFWRRVETSGVLRTGVIAHKSGELDRIEMSGDKMKRFQRFYPGGERLKYEADYADNGVFIKSARWFAEDGSLRSSFQRQADGTEVRNDFGPGGALLVTRSIAPTGEVTTTRANGIAIPAPQTTAPVTQTLTFGEITVDGQGKKPVLTVRLVNDKLASWEWFRSDGKVSQRGKVLPTGELEVANVNEQGNVRSIQIFTPWVEDWQRTHYRLSKVTVFFASGEVDRVLLLNSDGVTLRDWMDYAVNGKLNFHRIYDEKGFQTAEERLVDEKLTRTPTERTPTSTPNKIADEFGPAPGGTTTKHPVFTPSGKPFTGDTDKGGTNMDSFFVNPGEVVTPPAPVYYGDGM